MFAVVLLASALAANTVMFSVADSLVFSPAPFDEPERVVFIGGSAKAPDRLNLAASAAILQKWLEQPDLVEAAAGALQKSVFLKGATSIEEVGTYDVTVGFFDVLRVRPRWGRGFSKSDVRDPGVFAVILGEKLARRRFGSPERAVGQRLDATAGPHVVVGVMDRTFIYPTKRFEMWRALDPVGPLTRNFGGVSPMIRIRSDVPFDRQADLLRERAKAVGASVGVPSYSVAPRPVFSDAPASRRTFVFILVAAAFCLLLAACASVTSMELAGVTKRSRTMAVQLALGASRNSLARVAAIEGGIITATSFALAALLAGITIDLIGANLPVTLLRGATNAVDLDVRALLVMAALALLAGAMASASPMMAARRSTLIGLLKSEDRTAAASGRAAAVRRVLTAAQVAVAVALVTGALLFTRTYANLVSVDKGFESRGLYSMDWSLPADFASRPLQTKALEILRGAPGVAAVTTSAPPPSTGDSPGPAPIEIDGGAPANPPVPMGRKWVDVDYFKVIPLPLKSGRLPEITDTPDEVVVPERFARRFFPGGEAVGHTFRRSPNEPVLRIIGVVGDFRIDRTRMPQDGDRELYYYYIPPPAPPRPVAAQASRPIDTGGSWQYLSLTIRLAPDASPKILDSLARQAAPELQATITNVDESYASLAADTRLAANVVSAFGWFAFALAMAGVFGVMTFVVVGRTREIGIRVALGADRTDIRRLVLGSSLRMVMAGAIAGVAVSVAASRWLEAQMFGISATDPATYAAACSAAIAVSLFASWLPAREAASVDPAVTLRAD